MRRARLAQMCFLGLALLSAFPAAAQIGTGLPPFGSFARSPFDQVNLGNNNVFFPINIVDKAGRGMPFTYQLVYNAAIWNPTNASGQKIWTPAPSWGWGTMSSANAGSIAATWQQGYCTDWQGFQYYWNIWAINTFYDSSGGVHQLGGFTLSDWNINGGDCPGGGSSSASVPLNDGSGETVTFDLDDYGPVATVYGPSGNWGQALFQGLGGGWTLRVGDTNGNAQSYIANQNPLVYTDTLGATALKATSGSGTNTYTYTGPDGNAYSYTVHYVPYTVQTSFGCSGVAEYGPSVQ